MTIAENQSNAENQGIFYRWLNRIERIGNAIPNPALLFVVLAFLVLLLSALVSWADLSVKHPGTGETIRAVNLLSVDGLHKILGGLITNFTGFAPLGVVLVAILGISVAEASGLISAVMRVERLPKRCLITCASVCLIFRLKRAIITT